MKGIKPHAIFPMKKFLLSIDKENILIALILAFGLFLRLYKLDQLNLWGDEIFRALHADNNPLEIIRISAEDTNPPLYPLILHFFIQLFGKDEFAIRLPSVIFSFGSLILFAKILRRNFGTKTRILGLLLLATNIVSIYYAREARSYALLEFASLASFYFLDLFISTKAKRYTLLFILSTIVGLYSHNLFLFFLISQIIFIIYKLRFKIKNRLRLKSFRLGQPLGKVFLAYLIALIFYLPWSYVFFGQTTKVKADFWVGFDPKTSAFITFSDLLKGYILYGQDSLGVFIQAIQIITICLFVFGIIFEGIQLLKNRKSHLEASLFFILPFTLIYLVSFKRPLLYVRYIAFTNPFFLLTILKGIKLLISKSRFFFLIFFILILQNLVIYVDYLNHTEAKPSYEDATDFVIENLEENDGIFHTDTGTFFALEFYGEIENHKIIGEKSSIPYYCGTALTNEYTDYTQDRSEFASFNRIWLVGENQDNHDDFFKPDLSKKGEYHFPHNIRIELFTRDTDQK